MKVAKFEFALRTENSFGLPDFKGSTFRGKFGHVLKRTICVMPHHNCEICQLRAQCAYPYLFETHNERREEVPRPFILEPPLSHKRFYLKDEWMYLNLVLVGRAIEFLPYFVYCFDRMGKEGVGVDRGRYCLASVRGIDLDGSKREIYNHQTQQLSNHFSVIDLEQFKAGLRPQVTLEFLTPAQLKKEGRPVRRPEFAVLLGNILRRYHSLRYFHDSGEREKFEIDWAAAEKIEIVQQDLQDRQLKRFSNRQQRPVVLNGFEGRITYRGNLSQFLPWLKIGEYLHVGKGAVFGMGWYRVV